MLLAQASQVQMPADENINRPFFMVPVQWQWNVIANLVLPILHLFSSAPPALIYGVVVCDLAVRGVAKLKILYTIALFAAKQHAAMPWGLKGYSPI
jgi:hypothetical protein